MVEEASNNSQLMVRDYWPKVWKRSLIITVLMELTLTLVVALALVFVGFTPSSFEFIIVIIAVIATSLGVNIILVSILMRPLRDISAALTHASGEITAIKPPNPVAKSYQYEGLMPLLQLIYSLSASRFKPKASNASASDLERAINQSSAGLIICDEQGNIQFASQNAPIIKDERNQNQLKLIFEKDDEFSNWLANCRTNEVKSETSWLRVPNAIIGTETRKIYDLTATYEKDSPAPVVIATFDRTDHYQPEDDQLDFIAFAAHELRGPVTVIRGYLDVLKEEISGGRANTPEQLELLSRLTVSANRLSGYISNILNASRFDRQHLSLRLSEQHLDHLYHGISDDMSLRARTQNRMLSVVIPSDLPTIAADTSSLSEAIANLIDNAIKYSYEGGLVSVIASQKDDTIRIDIVDQGIGMPSNVVSNLFHKFYRSHRSRKAFAGTGIGLYITKAIVESHGGRVEVRSEDSKGSTFSITLPTYASVADKLIDKGNNNKNIIRSGSEGWIKNHSRYMS